MFDLRFEGRVEIFKHIRGQGKANFNVRREWRYRLECEPCTKDIDPTCCRMKGEKQVDTTNQYLNDDPWMNVTGDRLRHFDKHQVWGTLDYSPNISVSGHSASFGPSIKYGVENIGSDDRNDDNASMFQAGFAENDEGELALDDRGNPIREYRLRDRLITMKDEVIGNYSFTCTRRGESSSDSSSTP